MADLTISLIQTPLFWEQPTANLALLESRLVALPAETELVLLPEMFTTGFSMDAARLAETMDGPSIQWMKEQARKHRKILAGSLMIEEGGHYYNRLIWMLPNGQFGTYDKRHCFSLAGEDRYFRQGEKRLIASVKGWRVNLCICYDLRFPVWSRQQTDPDAADSAPEYDLLVYVANWPDRRIKAWETLLPARAIENQCYVAAVNRIGEDGHGIPHSGHSMVVDPMGEIHSAAPGAAETLTVTLKRGMLTELREKFPFWKDADRFLIQ